MRDPEEASSSRTRSPVEIWGTPSKFDSLLAYVPLPTPGQPKNTHCTLRVPSFSLLTGGAILVQGLRFGSVFGFGFDAMRMAAGSETKSDNRRIVKGEYAARMTRFSAAIFSFFVTSLLTLPLSVSLSFLLKFEREREMVEQGWGLRESFSFGQLRL